MKRLLRWAFNFAAAVSLLLFVAAAYLMCRSWIARDQFSISRQMMFVAACDSGRIEFASATCMTATPTWARGALDLVRGVPTVYSQRLELRHKSMLPGSGDITLDHTGLQTWTYNYYAGLVRGDDRDLGSSPLVNDVTAATIPAGVLLILLAIAPALRMLSYWFRRRPKGER